MEFDLVERSLVTTTTTSVGVIVLALITIILLMKKRRNIVDLPPGPEKLPIIGNLHIISQPFFRCLRDLAKQYGPIMHLKLGEVDTIIVSSPEMAKEILKGKDPVFTDRPDSIALKIFWYNYTSMTFCPYGGYWRQMRKFCILELLSAKSVRSFASIRQDEVSRLVASLRLSDGNPINLTRKVTHLMNSVTCRAAVGKVCKDKDSLIRLITDSLEMGAGFSVADVFPSSRIAHFLSWGTKLRLWRMRRTLDLILDDIIREHETRTKREVLNNRRSGNGEFGNEDLVDVLLRIKNEQELEFPIGYDNIKAVLYDMFTGGTATSSSTVDWAMTELIRNPRVMAKAQAEIRQAMKEKSKTSFEDEDIQDFTYLKLVIMETLRLHPQGATIPRVSRETCRISGYTIPKRVKVLVNVWAIHRDPSYWADPETFEPERFQNKPPLESSGNDFRYLPFGSGKRMCPGMSFGIASVGLPLAHLLYHFNWKLPEPDGIDSMNMIENSGLGTSRKDPLFVVATPYQPPL